MKQEKPNVCMFIPSPTPPEDFDSLENLESTRLEIVASSDNNLWRNLDIYKTVGNTDQQLV